METVAALYVDPNGVYAGLEGVECWDEQRDARLYAGPWPVVAHPPCNKWSPLAYINRRRLAGYEIGDDGGCFEAALNAVETWGGVLEHPAKSLAWKHFGLPRPERYGWWSNLMRPGVMAEVSQAAYGHRAQKETWLYYVGPSSPALEWHRPYTDKIISGFLHTGTDESRRIRPREAASTPPAFRDVLLEMARSATRVTA